MKTTAELLTEQMTTPEGTDRRAGHPEAIYALITDGDQVHCMTEGMLDAWWNSLAPADKAEIHERWLDADLYAADDALAFLRDPLTHICAAAEKLSADHAMPFRPTGAAMPTFHPSEIAFLREQHRRQQ